jgi:TPR repeat protein
MAHKPICKRRASYFGQAAKAGDMQAANELGLMYYQGNGVEQNAEEAIKHIRKAADSGLAQAQYNLGLLVCQRPRRREGHLSTAGDWFQKAARPGVAGSRSRLRVAGLRGRRRHSQGCRDRRPVAAGRCQCRQRRRPVDLRPRAGLRARHDQGSRVEAAKFYLLAKQAGKSDPDLDVMLQNLSSPQMGDAERRARVFSEELKQKRLNPSSGGKSDAAS